MTVDSEKRTTMYDVCLLSLSLTLLVNNGVGEAEVKSSSVVARRRNSNAFQMLGHKMRGRSRLGRSREWAREVGLWVKRQGGEMLRTYNIKYDGSGRCDNGSSTTG